MIVRSLATLFQIHISNFTVCWPQRYWNLVFTFVIIFFNLIINFFSLVSQFCSKLQYWPTVQLTGQMVRLTNPLIISQSKSLHKHNDLPVTGFIKNLIWVFLCLHDIAASFKSFTTATSFSNVRLLYWGCKMILEDRSTILGSFSSPLSVLSCSPSTSHSWEEGETQWAAVRTQWEAITDPPHRNQEFPSMI